MAIKELQETIVNNMKKWQKIEDVSVRQCEEIIAKTKNSVVRLVMEIIQADSERHHKVEEMIIQALEIGTVTLTPDELSEVWDIIQMHIEMEKKAASYARESLEAIKAGPKWLIPEYLLNYLLEDEAKHDHMLESLEKIKGGIYPYA